MGQTTTNYQKEEIHEPVKIYDIRIRKATNDVDESKLEFSALKLLPSTFAR